MFVELLLNFELIWIKFCKMGWSLMCLTSGFSKNLQIVFVSVYGLMGWCSVNIILLVLALLA